MNQTLVRLVNDNQENDGKKGIFKAIFNDGILVGKDAQIALQSIVLNRSHEEFTVNSTNDVFKFSLGAGGTIYEAKLNHKIYNQLTFIDLLKDIEDKMNLLLSTDKEHEANRQISVSFSDDEKVFIEVRGLPSPDVIPADSTGIQNLASRNGVGYFRYEDVSGVVIDTLRYQIVNQLKAARKQIFQLTRPIGDGDITSHLTAFAFGERPMGSGGSIFRVRISKLTQNINGKGSGFVMGLMRATDENYVKLRNSNRLVDPSQQLATGGGIKTTDLAFYVRTDGTIPVTGGFKVKPIQPDTLPNLVVGTGTPPHRVTQIAAIDEADYFTDCQNDVVTIEITEGQIQVYRYRVVSALDFHSSLDPYGGTWQMERDTLFRQKYNPRQSDGSLTQFIPVIAILGDVTQTCLSEITFTQKPDSGVTNSIITNTFASRYGGGGINTTPHPKFEPILHKFYFDECISVARYIGFNTDVTNPQNTLKNNFYIDPFLLFGDETLGNVLQTNTFIIELLSETLDSYDSFFEGRKNILYSIPVTNEVRANSYSLTYEPNNLIYINLKNRNKQLITRIVARVVTDQYKEIELNGQSEINLLLKY